MRRSQSVKLDCFASNGCNVRHGACLWYDRPLLKLPHDIQRKGWIAAETLRVKSEANNRNMTSKQQRTGASILFLRYLFAISLLVCTPSKGEQW